MKQPVLAVVIFALVAGLSVSLVAQPRDLYADTWDARDGLGRTLADQRIAGPSRSNRTVGIFYFLWHGQHGQQGPFNIEQLLRENPENPAWGPPGAFHHWSEPELGYYIGGEPYVIRRHVQMLEAAGVDMLICDVTNGFAYIDVVKSLFRTLDTIRAEGGWTPTVAFIAWNNHLRAVDSLWKEVYQKDLGRKHWAMWKGKPLLLTNPEGLTEEQRQFFTIRQSWAWSAAPWFGDGKDRWPWLDHTPQKWGWHEAPDKPEFVPVAVAQHPTTNIGRSYHGGKQPPESEWRSAEKPYFREQAARALAVDPEFVFITGWNEWVAQRFVADKPTTFIGKPLPAGGSTFVDAYNAEYNRDIEPVRGLYTDASYYQMVDFIRRYKGVRSLPPARALTTPRIDGRFDEWPSVTPVYHDSVGDTEHRNAPGWGAAGPYVDISGRNDIMESRMAVTPTHLYAYARTRQALTSPAGDDWMLLFIDTDGDLSTGWNGYELVINRSIRGGRLGSIERWTGQGWKPVGNASLAFRNNELELAIPRNPVRLSGRLNLHFKWADHCGPLETIVTFSERGDAAPDRRYAYRLEER